VVRELGLIRRMQIEKNKFNYNIHKYYVTSSILKNSLKNNTNLSLVVRKKEENTLLYNLFPINYRIKYPIFFNVLIEKIKKLKIMYNYSCLNEILIYKFNDLKQVRKQINIDLKNKGGIYLWWCQNSGLFYIGSAKSFVGKNGRLNDYFQKNRLLNINNSKISLNIKKDMLKYPKLNWNLIILENMSTLEITKFNLLKQKEQFWMLLLPTYNRSLVVGSNEGLPMTNEKRMSISTLIYIYELSKEGNLLINSEQKIYGIRELSRTGIHSVISGDIIKANLWDIQSYLKSGLPFKNRFILSRKSLKIEEFKTKNFNNLEESHNTSRNKGVWVYNFNNLNFIEYFDNIKSCREKYKIPTTTFLRIRKHKLNYKGYLFSNYNLF
jgi:hypothetical protein